MPKFILRRRYHIHSTAFLRLNLQASIADSLMFAVVVVVVPLFSATFNAIAV